MSFLETALYQREILAFMHARIYDHRVAKFDGRETNQNACLTEFSVNRHELVANAIVPLESAHIFR